MKIIVLQDRLRSGGTERHSILIARELARAGHSARLVTFRPGGRLAEDLSGVDAVALQPFDTGIDWFGPGLSRKVLGRAPDIVLCMGKTANCFAGRLQRRAAARALPTRVVATLRAGGRLPWFYYASVRKAAHVVANSQEAADTLVSRHRLRREQVAVIRNSLVFPEALSGRNPSLRAKLGAGTSTLVLLNVGMFRPEKNQRFLIEMAAGLPRDGDWQLWFVGDGPARGACEGLASSLGLAGRVRFLGFARNPEPYYGAADVAVHASREEALSNFLIEAQAHGLPAVACEAMGISECMIAGETGWIIRHGDLAGFHAAIARLAAAGGPERTARSERAKSFARSSFDPDTQLGAYLSLFGSLLRTAQTASVP